MTTTEVLPDEATLRRARRQRVLDEMEAAGVDVLVIGREANARYVTGVRRLWTAGSHAFGPGCVLVRSGGDVHLLSTWDEGVPDDIPHEHLYGISFNPASYLEVLRSLPGSASFRTVATDALTPNGANLLAGAFPAATLVDGEALLRRARRVKLPAEIEAVRRAVGIAEAALATAVAELRPGATERGLTGAFLAAMASLGVTTPATQDVAWVASGPGPWHRARRDAPIAAGDLVAFDAGVLADGYAGEVGRTYVAGAAGAPAPLLTRATGLLGRLLDACRPGVAASTLLDAYVAAGVALPPVPVARGLGLGFDLPLVTAGLPGTAAAERLEEGMVLALTAFVGDGTGVAYLQEPVVVRAGGPEVLAGTPAAAATGS